jgi:LuxR family maltose regulon positive regulatory protein
MPPHAAGRDVPSFAGAQDFTLLRTKLYIPSPRAELVPRPHLIERLNQGLTGRLTLVSAPAGFGKTTLLGAWMPEISPDRIKPGWLSLDENDNDPTRFFLYLIAALQRLVPSIGHTVAGMLQTHQPVAVETVMSAIINELAAVPEDLMLVLDDYHLITNQAIHGAITFLLQNMPPNLHLIIATRMDPPLHLPQLRARGQAVELRAADLRFTPAETAILFNQVLGMDLSRADIEVLEQRTEGWIAGLHLAVLALRYLPDEAERIRFVRTFRGSHRYVLDYLVDEVLSRQTGDVQAFLYQTAWLERFCAPLCDAVTGRDDSDAILALLDRSNLFIVPLDDERRWYRYHRLFADLLRARASDDADGTERHRRAAGWYQERGFVDYAFEHWMRAGDFAGAATLVETQALTHLNQGQTSLVLAWIDRLPPEMLASRPWLLIFRAWGLLLTGEAISVPNCLQQAERAGATEDAAPEMAGHVAAIRAYVAALRGDVSAAMAQAQQALTQLKPDDLATRSVVAFVLGGMHLLAGEVGSARLAFTEAAQTGQAAGNRHVSVPAWCAAASLQVDLGHLGQAEALYYKALDLTMTPGGRPLPLAAQPYNGLAHLAYERNDLLAASDWLDKSLELGRQWHNPETTVNALLNRAAIQRAQGDRGAAAVTWGEAAQTAAGRTLTPTSASSLTAMHLTLLLDAGDVRGAVRLAAERGLTSDGPANFAHQAEHVALAQILLAQGRPEEAQALLARLISAAQEDGRNGSLIKLLALQALTSQVQHQTDRALLSLEHALSLAKAEGFVRSLVDQGHPLATLLAQLPPSAYRDILLAACDEGPTVGAPAAFGHLSERELEVLRLMAVGLNNQAIADDLVLALGTVKAHAVAIYRKLDVNSRIQAVARARELGIIP